MVNPHFTRSAGFPTCCIADFLIREPYEPPLFAEDSVRARIKQSAIQQVGKPALRGGAVSVSQHLADSAAVNSTQILWPCAPVNFSLAAGEIHVWAFSLEVSQSFLSELFATLSASERERASRFRFDVHRNRFIAGRGFLRTALSRYLDGRPLQIEFQYGPHGKPELAGYFASTGLRFNLAHSEDLALLAVGKGDAIGVDVERIRPVLDMDQLVERFFSPTENARFQALTKDERPAAFFNLWTRKEAWLKATGEGIGYSLKQVEVSFLPAEPARLIRIEGRGDEAIRWRLENLRPASGFTGALVCAAGTTAMRYMLWPQTGEAA